jgi:endonuclease/exonuclease/phosphatase (EEP) superfamily protein YafD
MSTASRLVARRPTPVWADVSGLVQMAKQGDAPQPRSTGDNRRMDATAGGSPTTKQASARPRARRETARVRGSSNGSRSDARPALATAARVLAAVPIALTVLPFGKTGRGWVRIWDFPRAQIAGLGVVAQAAMQRWGSASRTDRTLTAALGAALLYQAAKIAPYTPLYPRQVPDAHDVPADRCFRLFMANVLQENQRADLMLRAIAAADADVVCLVETNSWWVEQVEVLAKTYEWVVRCPLENHYGMVLFSRLPIVEHEVRYTVSDDVPSVRAVIRLRSGDDVDVFALHPPPPLPESPSYGRDAELVLTGQEIAGTGRPSVVVGDLNDVAWSYTAKLFQRVSHMVDPRVGRGLFSTFDANNRLARYPLDHVFHTREFTLKELRVMPYTGSDHFPILTELAYTPARKHEVEKPTPTETDLENAEEMVEDAREAKPYIDEEGRGKVVTNPS